MRAEDVLKRSAGYPEKFGDKFAGNTLSTLPAFVEWFSQYPDVTAFVEIKSESILAFGTEETARFVFDAIKPVVEHAVIISFHAGVLDAVRSITPRIPIGWVLREYDAIHEKNAMELNPEYLFCKTTRIPNDRLVWRGDWQWALYNTDTVDEALDFFHCGFDMLETNRIIDLLASPEFKQI